MKLIDASIRLSRSRYRPFLDKLTALFGEMDRAYETVAGQYAFHCSGCTTNCCLTRFYHHTLVECLYLTEGVLNFDAALVQQVRKRSLAVCDQMNAADIRGERIQCMCPLNEAQRCIAYRYRPMICRLHGIPYELHRPDGRVVRHPGCDAFFEQCRKTGRTAYIPFDRTPFYRRMAVLEGELRRELATTKKVKVTIAEMLVALLDEDHEIH